MSGNDRFGNFHFHISNNIDFALLGEKDEIQLIWKEQLSACPYICS